MQKESKAGCTLSAWLEESAAASLPEDSAEPLPSSTSTCRRVYHV